MTENRYGNSLPSGNAQIRKIQDASGALSQQEIVQLRSSQRDRSGLQQSCIKNGMIEQMNHMEEKNLFVFLKNLLKTRRNIQAVSFYRDERLQSESFRKENTSATTLNVSKDIINSTEEIAMRVSKTFSQYDVVGVSMNKDAVMVVYRANPSYNYKTIVQTGTRKVRTLDVYGDEVEVDESFELETEVSPLAVITHLSL